MGNVVLERQLEHTEAESSVVRTRFLCSSGPAQGYHAFYPIELDE